MTNEKMWDRYGKQQDFQRGGKNNDEYRYRQGIVRHF